MKYDVYVVMVDASDEQALEAIAGSTSNLTQLTTEPVDYKEAVEIMDRAEASV